MGNHLWHDLSPGKGLPGEVLAVIEIPQGSRSKFEIDKPSGLIKLDRLLYGAMHYPVNYGIIPQTLGEDGDPLDILVMTQAKLFPGCLIDARVIGVMHMLDQGVADDKIIAVATRDVTVAHIQKIEDLPASYRIELDHFFERYSELEGKTVTISGFEASAVAHQIIQSSLERYQKSRR
ncbi:MAG: inorganic diphosphatase [Bdellovibrionales bacterium]|nr:inorganic diphosphatase [Bdellovibrionales bacterium]